MNIDEYNDILLYVQNQTKHVLIFTGNYTDVSNGTDIYKDFICYNCNNNFYLDAGTYNNGFGLGVDILRFNEFWYDFGIITVFYTMSEYETCMLSCDELIIKNIIE